MRRRLHVTYLSIIAVLVATVGAQGAFAGGGSPSSGSHTLQAEGCGSAGCAVDPNTPKGGFYVGDTTNGHSIEFTYSATSHELTRLRRDGQELLTRGAVRNDQLSTSQNGYNFSLAWTGSEVVTGRIQHKGATETFDVHREYGSDSF